MKDPLKYIIGTLAAVSVLLLVLYEMRINHYFDRILIAHSPAEAYRVNQGDTLEVQVLLRNPSHSDVRILNKSLSCKMLAVEVPNVVSGKQIRPATLRLLANESPGDYEAQVVLRTDADRVFVPVIIRYAVSEDSLATPRTVRSGAAELRETDLL